MKKIYLFFIFLFITGCTYNLASNTKGTPISCPQVLFASDHKIFIGTSYDNISLDNVEYQGKINNTNFSKQCTLIGNLFSAELSILFVVEPLVDEIDYIDMPFYIAILNQDNEFQDMLYFSVSQQFKKDQETKKAIETEIIKKLPLLNESINEKSIVVIGFVLDKKRNEILN